MGRFCSACGEKRLTHHDYSIRHYALELFEVITHLESKLLRSGWLLVSQPGFLSHEHLLGRRVRYVAPLKLFLIVSLVYFLSITIFYANTFTTPLRIHLEQNDYYPTFAASLVQRKLASTHLDYAQLEERFDHKAAVLSHTLLFTLIPIIALLFWALLFRKRRYFAEHLVIATHFWSFALLFIGVLLPLCVVGAGALARLGGLPPEAVRSDAILSTAVQASFAAYLFFMFQRSYALGAWLAAALALAFAWSFFHIVWLFRFILFLATMSAV